MRERFFKVKAVRPEENMAESLLAFSFLILFIYLMIGMPVWIQLFQGQHVTSPGLLYEPIVEWFMKS